MNPCLPLNYHRNHLVTNVVFPAELSIDTVDRHPFLPYLPNIVLSQFRRSIQRSPMVSSSTTVCPVGSVVRLSTCSKMYWVTARGVVARMKDEWVVVGNWAVDQNVNKSVGKDRLPSVSSIPCADNSIASLVARPVVRPARLWSIAIVYLTQNKMNLLWGKLWAHCTVLSCGVTPTAVNAARGFSADNYTQSGDR